MTSFPFGVDEKTASQLTRLASEEVRVIIDLDSQQGGIFASKKGAQLVWTWMEDIDIFNGEKEAELPSHIEVVCLALENSPSSGALNEVPKTDLTLNVEVSADDFILLSSLSEAGWSVELDLDPGGGGICARHAGGSWLRWWFISEVELKLHGNWSFWDGSAEAIEALCAALEPMQAGAQLGQK